MRKDHPRITHTWYTDVAEAGGIFEGIRRHLDDLMVREPQRGYFPEPTNIVLVVSPRNVFQVEALF